MNVEQIKTVSRTKYLHSLAKLNLKEKYESRLIVTLGDGSFRVTPDLLSFLNLYKDSEVILLDMYENPVRVNAGQLFDLAKTVYDTVMTDWRDDFQTIMKQR
jgi:hypothetical protein